VMSMNVHTIHVQPPSDRLPRTMNGPREVAA
jgi:hypothetical protein